eukprot:EG_transcript_7262
MTLPEILQDWNSLCGFDSVSLDRTAVPPKAPTRLTAEQIATFVQVGAALSMLQYALLDPVQNVCGLLLLCYAYGKGLLGVAVLSWLLVCLLKNRNSADVVAAIRSNHPHNLNHAAQWAGKCSTLLELLATAVTSQHPIMAYASAVLAVGFAASLYALSWDPAWHATLQAYSPVLGLGALYCVAIWALGHLSPHVVPALGWPDPLHLLFNGIQAAPVPKTHASLDWATAIPVAAVDWAAVAASLPAQDTPTNAESAPEAPKAEAATPAAAPAAAPVALASDKLEDILAEVDRLADTGREAAQCLALLARATELYPDQAEVLWRIARAHDELFVAEKNAKKKEEFARKGAAVATRATELEPENPAAHRWRGVMLGRSVDFMGVTEKVATGVVVRESFERALALEPEGGYSLFCVASWYLAVGELSWVERKAARMVFKNFPENPFADGLALFLKAESVADPRFVVPVQNLLSMGKCYSYLKQKDKAKEALQRAVHLPTTRPDELQAKEDAAKLLRSLK